MYPLTVKFSYTTGVYAAAASMAAVRMLLSGEKRENESVVLPSGERALIDIASVGVADDSAWGQVVKQPNQDIDVTKGVSISVTARFLEVSQKKRISIKGGQGVGIVTLPGLQIKVGEPAINPVPLRMIRAGVTELMEDLESDLAIELTISALNGEELAKKTFNPRLGITGGISIIGTTGIVRPMSGDRWKESLKPQVDVSIAAGFKRLVLTFGNLGEKAALDLGFNKRQIVQMSNFVGFILDVCMKGGVKEVLLVGHIGKVIKITDGHLDTHSKRAKQDLSMIVSLATESGFSKSKIVELKSASSGEAILRLLGNDRQRIIDTVASIAKDVLSDHLEGKMRVAVAITDLSGKIVGSDSEARDILSKPSKWGVD